jgi:hypothetical protein
VSLPPDIVTSIGRAVERAGGDLDDALDLVAVWARLSGDRCGHIDALRREASERQEHNRARGETM